MKEKKTIMKVIWKVILWSTKSLSFYLDVFCVGCDIILRKQLRISINNKNEQVLLKSFQGALALRAHSVNNFTPHPVACPRLKSHAVPAMSIWVNLANSTKCCKKSAAVMAPASFPDPKFLSVANVDLSSS